MKFIAKLVFIVVASSISTVSLAQGVPKIPQLDTDIIVEGTQCASKSASISQEGVSRVKCLNAILPKRPSLSLSVPGSYFVGFIYTESEWKSVYGPQAGVDLVFTIPVRRPYLKFDGYGGGYDVFSLPKEMSWVFDVSFALNANISALKFDDKGVDFTGGFYIAPEVGVVWWGDNAKSVSDYSSLKLVIGLFLGGAVGDVNGFLIGVQPGVKFHFF